MNISKAGAICGPAAAFATGATSTFVSQASNSNIISLRKIVARTRGNSRGPITRLVSPGDIGQSIKPFVFLDAFQIEDAKTAKGFGWHPHSGIATVSVMLEGGMWFEESTSKGELGSGGVEFFRAAGGAWHRGGPKSEGRTKGFQLWVALPSELENNAPDSYYLAPDQVPTVGPARVILGTYEGVKSLIPSTPTINYFDVKLKAGEAWTYNVPAEHDVAWIAVYDGSVTTSDGMVTNGELAVFDDDAEVDRSILTFGASSDGAKFMLGTAVKHPYDLHLGYYSVHTSRDALIKGENEIKRIENVLKDQGVI